MATVCSGNGTAGVAGGVGISYCIHGWVVDMAFDQSMTVQAILRNELLDELTCDLCMMLDGIMLPANDPRWGTELGQYAHPNCRAIWVPILDTGTLDPTPSIDIPDIFRHGVAVSLIDSWDDMPIPLKGVDRLGTQEIVVDDIMNMLEPYEVMAGILLGEG